MTSLRFPRIVAVFFAALLMLMAAGTQLSMAVTPDQVTIEVDQTQTLGVCGFPIIRRDVGTLRIQDYFDQNGEFTFENAIFSNWRITLTNPANGKSVSSVRAYNERFVQYDDGFFKAVSAGLVAQLVIPGDGQVVANVGIISVMFDASEQPVSALVAGEHDGPIAQFVCPYLE